MGWLRSASRGNDEAGLAEGSPAADVHELLSSGGALFHHELLGRSALSPFEVETALWELVWRGRIHADSFHAIRSLLDVRKRKQAPRKSTRGLRRGTAVRHGGEGRWTLLVEEADADPDELAEAVAEQLLARWGVVFHALVAREQLVVPWREILWALRRLEARGLILGGRFVAGFSGEQYATVEAGQHLDRVRRQPRTGVRVEVNACDPANLTGIITPGARVRSTQTQSVVYVDGLPECAEAP